MLLQLALSLASSTAYGGWQVANEAARLAEASTATIAASASDDDIMAGNRSGAWGDVDATVTGLESDLGDVGVFIVAFLKDDSNRAGSDS